MGTDCKSNVFAHQLASIQPPGCLDLQSHTANDGAGFFLVMAKGVGAFS